VHKLIAKYDRNARRPRSRRFSGTCRDGRAQATGGAPLAVAWMKAALHRSNLRVR